MVDSVADSRVAILDGTGCNCYGPCSLELRTCPRSAAPNLPSLVVALLCGLLAAGCAGAPAQQMSDARQAIRAAEQAGAGQHAPALLAEAQQLVERARLNLEKGEYRQARDDADLARAKAMEARRLSEAATSPPAGS